MALNPDLMGRMAELHRLRLEKEADQERMLLEARGQPRRARPAVFFRLGGWLIVLGLAVQGRPAGCNTVRTVLEQVLVSAPDAKRPLELAR